MHFGMEWWGELTVTLGKALMPEVSGHHNTIIVIDVKKEPALRNDCWRQTNVSWNCLARVLFDFSNLFCQQLWVSTDQLLTFPSFLCFVRDLSALLAHLRV
jgi:hypothetical protein